jgi:hypothetical protein
VCVCVCYVHKRSQQAVCLGAPGRSTNPRSCAGCMQAILLNKSIKSPQSFLPDMRKPLFTLCVCVRVCLCVCTQENQAPQVFLPQKGKPYVCPCVCACAHAHTFRDSRQKRTGITTIFLYIHTCIHAYIHRFQNLSVSYTYMHTCIHTQIPESQRLLYIHAYMHTYTDSRISAESAFYWRVLAKHAVEKDDDDLMEAALPEISSFCNMLRYPCEHIHVHVVFVCCQGEIDVV